MARSQHGFTPPTPADIQTREVCFTPTSALQKPQAMYEHYSEVDGEADVIFGYSLGFNYDPNSLVSLSTFNGGGTVTHGECPCLILDYSLPLVPNREFNTVRPQAGALGSVVGDAVISLSDATPNVGDTATQSIEFVGPNGCGIPAEIEVTRLVAGGDLSLIQSSSLLRVLGNGDYRITVRLLSDSFGQPLVTDMLVQPSQMRGTAERFIILLGADSEPDDYIRGGGAPPVALPLASNLLWDNGNNTGHSAFRYNGVSEVTFRLNGGNAVSSVTGISILNGPQLVQIDGKEGLLDFLVERLGTSLAAPTGITATTPTLPAAQGKVVTDFFSEGNQGPFQLQVRNVTGGSVIWQALIMNAPYSVIPNFQGASIISTVNDDGTFEHLLTGDAPLPAFASVTVSGGSPIPVGTGANVEFFCEAV